MNKMLVILLVVISLQQCFATNIKLEMIKNEVVPDVIDLSPEKPLSVSYGDKEVNLGNELTPTEVKDEPTITWTAEPNTYYTCAMVDPDAPSRADPKYREVKHWLVMNIDGSDISTGDVIAHYMGSGPPKGTGLHRYIFLLYKQPKKIKFEEPFSPENSRANRFNFTIRQFADKYDLGQPIAGNFFEAQWDEYVEIRNKGIVN